MEALLWERNWKLKGGSRRDRFSSCQGGSWRPGGRFLKEKWFPTGDFMEVVQVV